ncbi:MAG: GAF domain-containing protein [Omnitrophica bacterium]|nr:GAF domain-containing protein [Candidatus Omnitrophota bacterium]
MNQQAKFPPRQLKKLNRKLNSSNKSLTSKTEHLTKAFAEIRRLNKSLEEQIKNKSLELNIAMKELNTVYTVSREVISTLDVQEVFSLIAKTVCAIINTKACILRMIDRDKKCMTIVSSHGISAKYIDNTPLKIGEGLSGIVATTGKPIACPQVTKEESVKYSYYINGEGYQSALGVPIVFNNEILGTIVTYDNSMRNYTKVEVMLLSTFASQIAVAIKNAQLHTKVHLNYLDTVNALALAMEARDPYTHGHAERVTAYAIEIARVESLSKKQVQLIQNCGKLHDVGKIAIADSILRKPGPLTENERSLIQLHPVKGVQMLAPLKFLEQGFPLIQYHHERFDGEGYPQGLKKTDTPVIARIFACADAFDAMTSDRPYRSKLTCKQAVIELEKNAGTQFDPYLVKKFISILQRKNIKLK